jgi:hypothetical protein
MIPVIPEVEPVAESAVHFQIQFIQGLLSGKWGRKPISAGKMGTQTYFGGCLQHGRRNLT